MPVAPPFSVPLAGGERLFTVFVVVLSDAFFPSSFNEAKLAAGVSFGKNVKSEARLFAASSVMA